MGDLLTGLIDSPVLTSNVSEYFNNPGASFPWEPDMNQV